MKTIKGNLLDYAEAGYLDAIVHGCNCFHAMGGGIAAQIAQRFPEAVEADYRTERGDSEKLGTISVARHGELTIVNGYTQYMYSSGQREVSYVAVLGVMREVKRRFGDLRIGYPKIGAGLAGGDWEIIAPIIECELTGCDHTLFVLEGPC